MMTFTGTAVVTPCAPYVSVVIPTYKRLALLKKTLSCLFDQTYPAERYEIIVVDDESPDDTAK
jgi:glycosyltransferase involved in cell wall biosynthesis